MAATVLLVEDETGVREAVRFHLERSGYTVRAHATALGAWEHLSGTDVVVLDWMLPDEAGISWLRRLRDSSFAGLPVLMLTARASEVDRVEGLDAGADDYLTKPFSAAELAARVRALLRRSQGERQRGVLRVGQLELNLDAGTALFAKQDLNLTRREFDLLGFLAAHPGRVYSRQELLDKVWGVDFIGGERTVDQHITQLRAHLGDEPSEPAYLETVRGKGYRMRAEPL
jgi:two-component system, OmpR family, response regulator RegX3